ncbi:hypothetical protein, partial [Kocuria rosea]|uniref:hypothetical protein n=1 Tax=Kocuria rosea TaxID=1275 RepID=UPI002B24A762
PVYLVPQRWRGTRYRKPGFINGTLPRPNGTVKVFFYHFDSAGDLVVTKVPAKYVELVDWTKEGRLL